MNKFDFMKEAATAAGMRDCYLATLVAIWRYAKADLTRAFPGIERLARDRNKGTSTIRAHIAWLKDHGWLAEVSRGGRTGDGRSRKSEYELLIPDNSGTESDVDDSRVSSPSGSGESAAASNVGPAIAISDDGYPDDWHMIEPPDTYMDAPQDHPQDDTRTTLQDEQEFEAEFRQLVEDYYAAVIVDPSDTPEVGGTDDPPMPDCKACDLMAHMGCRCGRHDRVAA